MLCCENKTTFCIHSPFIMLIRLKLFPSPKRKRQDIPAYIHIFHKVIYLHLHICTCSCFFSSYHHHPSSFSWLIFINQTTVLKQAWKHVYKIIARWGGVVVFCVEYKQTKKVGRPCRAISKADYKDEDEMLLNAKSFGFCKNGKDVDDFLFLCGMCA